MNKLFLLVSFVLAVHAHSWMRTPVSRYTDNATPSASTTAPCGDGTTYPETTTIYQGRYFPVSWENNGHDDSQASVTISLLNVADETTYSILDTTTYPSGSDTANDPSPYQVRLADDVPVGNYILQWAWAGYYTCAAVVVEPNPNPTIILDDGTPESNTATAEYVFYEATLDETDQHLLVEISGPSGGAEGYLQVIMSKSQLPTEQDFEETDDTSGDESIAFGGCNDEDAGSFFIGVVGKAGATGVYQITATSYDPYVNSGNELESGSHTGYKYYKTDSFETYDAKRRVVIESDGTLNQDDDYVMALDCDMSDSEMIATLIGDSSACWQLTTDEDTKYIKVPPQEDSYTIRTEEGSCEDIDGAVSIIASLSLIALLLVL